MSGTEGPSTMGPEESELRVLLLCNNGPERTRVLSLVMGVGDQPINIPEHCPSLRVSVDLMKKTKMVVVPSDLLFSKTTEKKTREMMESCVNRCNPGPHIFLLALQPEYFNDQQEKKISSILNMFSGDSFHRSVIMVLSPLQQSSSRHNPQLLVELTQKCQGRVLPEQNFERSELMEVFNKILEENCGEHLGSMLDDQQREEKKFSSSSETGSSLRILLLGENKQSQLNLCKLIQENQDFIPENQTLIGHISALLGRWRRTNVTFVTFSNIFSREREYVKQHLKTCVSNCHPGPNLLLLLVEPSNFTEKKRHRLKFILGLFGKEAFQHSLVATVDVEDQNNVSVDRLLTSCGGRSLYMMGKDVGAFMEELEMIREEDISLSLSKNSLNEKKNVALNLILCGSNAKLKTLASQAFSSQRELRVLELPALFGASLKIAMEESFQCVSQCEPMGAHAFILVLPAALTYEDQKEIEMLQKIFGPRIFNLTLIVFSVESELITPDLLNFLKANEEIQQLCKRYGGRSDVFNLKDKNQIPELMDMLVELRSFGPPGYSIQTFAHVQIEKNLQQENLIRELQDKLDKTLTGQKDIESPDCLRIVLLGKTGNGKSSSGNTILGKTVFQAKTSTEPVTLRCEKGPGEVDGRPVFVVDTPGLFDRNLSHEEVYKELVKCISMLAPGPHVFLLVLPLGRFTPEDEKSLKLLKKGFGKNADKFTIVLFTKGDALKDENLSIQQYIQESKDSFKKLISDCGERFHVFENKKKNHAQVRELIEKIDTMVRVNGGECFTNEMLQEAEAAIQKEEKRILKEKEEEIKWDRQELEKKYKAEIDNMTKRIEEQKTEIDRERNLRQEQLKEKEDIIIQQEKTKYEQEIRVKEEEENKNVLEERERLACNEKIEKLQAKLKQDINMKETVEQELKKVRADTRAARAACERERAERFKDNQQRTLDKFKEIQKLKDEYKLEKEKLEREAKEEEQRRRQEEENQRKDLEEKHLMSVQQMKESFEEEARKQAEEMNGFKEKYTQVLMEQEEQNKSKEEQIDLMQALLLIQAETMKKKSAEDIQKVVRCVTRTRENIKKVRELVKRQEKEMKSEIDPESKETLQSKHEKEIAELIQGLLNRLDINPCPIV